MVSSEHSLDPVVPKWTELQLPPGWPDALRLATPVGLWTLIQHAVLSLVKRSPRALVPAGLPHCDALADYMLHSFHGLPNGYFSQKVASTYETGFEMALLGRLPQMRRWLAETLGGCKSVLDVGAGSGSLARDLVQAGVPEVWGVDPIPYVLKVAAERVPQARFVPAAVEALPFPNERFEGVGILYVLHEVPSDVHERGLREIFRVLTPGGRLSMLEPAHYHLDTPWWRLLLRGQLAALYFKGLANAAWEPFLPDWRRLDLEALLTKIGFVVESNETRVPFMRVVARKP
jgi:ubiquinone/menaquinone biosynthesis C-methylase UbiE